MKSSLPPTQYNPGIFILLILTAFLTAFYMGRQVLYGLLRRHPHPRRRRCPRKCPVITIPLIILALLSVLGGLLNIPGVDTLEHWLEHTIESRPRPQFTLLVALHFALIVALPASGCLAGVRAWRVSEGALQQIREASMPRIH